jgi:hypothetical protein
MIANPATHQTNQDLQIIMLKVVETNMKVYQIVLDMPMAVLPPFILSSSIHSKPSKQSWKSDFAMFRD